jgi:hypothetical protein
MLIALCVPTWTCHCLGRLFYGSWNGHPRCTRVWRKFKIAIIFIFFVIYPSLASFALRGLLCKNYGLEGRLLYPDHRVNCLSAEYEAFFGWIVVAICIYPAGIPVLFLCMLFRYEIPHMSRRKQATARFTAMLLYRRAQISSMATVRMQWGFAIHMRTNWTINGSHMTQPLNAEMERRVAYLFGGSQFSRNYFTEVIGQAPHQRKVPTWVQMVNFKTTQNWS